METTLEAFGLDIPAFRLVRGYAGMPPKRAWYRLVFDPVRGEEQSSFCCMEQEGHNHGNNGLAFRQGHQRS